MAYIYDLTDTWNAGGTTFTAIKMNVTDTASAAASLLMDLQVGGASRFYVGKDGNAIAFVGLGFANGSRFYNDALRLISTAEVSWGNGTGLNGGTADIILRRDAADTLALRRSTNAQTFRVYNTFTDASNYERGFVRWATNVLEIGAEAAGTGSGRQVRVVSSASTAFYQVDGNGLTLQDPSGGNVTIRTGSLGLGGRYQEMAEMTAPAAPSTNGVRIYAEDNGAGKTRLMALFATGAAQQIAIEP